jgi:hypothetical protein
VDADFKPKRGRPPDTDGAGRDMADELAQLIESRADRALKV